MSNGKDKLQMTIEVMFLLILSQKESEVPTEKQLKRP